MENNNKKEFKQVHSMGQLWTKESKNNNKKFLSGYITLDKDYKKGDVIYFSVFNNLYKKNDRHPDYIIKKSEVKTKNTNDNNNNFF